MILRKDLSEAKPELLWSEPVSKELKDKHRKVLTLQVFILFMAITLGVVYPYLFYSGYGDLFFLISIEILFSLIALLAIYYLIDYRPISVFSTGIQMSGDRIYDILHHRHSIIDFKDIHMAIYEKPAPPRRGFIVLIGDFLGIGMTFLVEGESISEVDKYIQLLIEKGIRVVIKKDWKGTPMIEEIFRKIMQTKHA